jgi:DNA polymerase/3'-5' exonuclease PolX
MSNSVAIFKKMKLKRPIELVLPHAKAILDQLSPFCERAEIVGSVRRGKGEVGDVELLLIPKRLPVLKKEQLELFNAPEYDFEVVDALNAAINRFNVYKGGLEQGGKMVQFFGPRRISFDIFTAELDNYGYQKVIRTGPHDHNVGYIIPRLKEKGYQLENAHILKDGVIIPIYEEEDLYRLMDSPFIPPNERHIF